MEKERIIHPFIKKILSGFYHTESIQTVNFRELQAGKYEAEFEFLPYKKVVRSLSHVSANQIHEAIMESMYLVTAKEIEKGNIVGFTLEDFLSFRAAALYREIIIKFKKEIHLFPEKNILHFTVGKTKNIKNKYSSFSITFDGFCKGEAKALFPTQAYLDQTLKK